MDKYIVNKRAQNKNGCHKIHINTCKRCPQEDNQIDLGKCMCPIEAKSRAKEYFKVVNGCKYCCNEIFFKKNQE